MRNVAHDACMSTAATTRTFLVSAVRQAVRGLLPSVEVTVVGGTLKTAKAEARRLTSGAFRGEVRSVTLLAVTK